MKELLKFGRRRNEITGNKGNNIVGLSIRYYNNDFHDPKGVKIVFVDFENIMAGIILYK